MSNGFRGIFTLALVLVIIIAFSLAFKSLFTPPPPTVEVTAATLDPNTININQVAILSITAKSNDKSKSHFLRIEFESHVLVTFLIGDQNLPYEGGKWYFTQSINPSATITQPFGVKGTLESGIAELKYQISVNFYLDGNQFDSKTFVLTVKR